MSSVNVERTGDVLRVTLARPESRNALDAATIRELTDAFADVGDVRVVLLAGEGQSFSAGADLEWMRASVELDYDDNISDALGLAEMIERIALCPVPVMARVHGHVFGAACGLVACADIAIAHRDTVFAFSEVKLGIIPAVISPYIVDTIGPSWSRRFFTPANVSAPRPPAASALCTKSRTIRMTQSIASYENSCSQAPRPSMMRSASSSNRWAAALRRRDG